MNYCQCGKQPTREWVAFHGTIRYEAFLCDNCQEEWKNCLSNKIKFVDLQHFNFKPVLQESKPVLREIMMKVWVVYHNTSWEHSSPFAVFSTKQLAEEWVRDTDSEISHGIQELELDHSPEDYLEIEEVETEYFSDYYYDREERLAAGEEK